MTLLASELVKLRTIRTPYVLLLLSALTAAAAAAALVGVGLEGDADRALSVGQAASFGTLFAAVAGILVVTNEYRHGTVMTMFLAEPRRSRVLLAKLGAAGGTGLVFGLAALGAAGAVALPWLSARGEPLALDGQALEAVGRVALAFTLHALVGAALGAIVHSQLGAIVGYLVWIFVIETVVTGLSGWLLTDFGEPDPVSKYLPGSALGGIVGGEGNEFLLRGGAAALVALAYAVLFSALGALSMTRRDP